MKKLADKLQNDTLGKPVLFYLTERENRANLNSSTLQYTKASRHYKTKLLPCISIYKPI